MRVHFSRTCLDNFSRSSSMNIYCTSYNNLFCSSRRTLSHSSRVYFSNASWVHFSCSSSNTSCSFSPTLLSTISSIYFLQFNSLLVWDGPKYNLKSTPLPRPWTHPPYSSVPIASTKMLWRPCGTKMPSLDFSTSKSYNIYTFSSYQIEITKISNVDKKYLLTIFLATSCVASDVKSHPCLWRSLFHFSWCDGRYGLRLNLLEGSFISIFL